MNSNVVTPTHKIEETVSRVHPQDRQKMLLLLAPAERAFFMNFLMPPLALGVINGYLQENNIEADVYDLNIQLKTNGLADDREQWRFLFQKETFHRYLNSEPGHSDPTVDELIKQLLKGVNIDDCDVIGISIGSNFSFFEIHSGFAIARYIQRHYGKTIVFGGDNIQYMYQFRDMFYDTWKMVLHYFSYAFVGPGERSLVALLRLLDTDKPKEEIIREYRKMQGAIYFDGDTLKSNTQDVPTLCRPSFDGLDTEAYKMCLKKTPPDARIPGNTYFFKWPFVHALLHSDLNRGKLKKDQKEETLFIPYIFNYNCPFRCAFCTQSNENKAGVVAKDAKEVVDDLEALMKLYGTKNFFFFNNCFNVNRKFVREFCDIVKERKLELYWSDCGRFNGLDKELLQDMYDAGCRKLIFGLDSGSPKILDLIDKRLDLIQARNVMKWCKEVGIYAEIEVILGFPQEHEKEFKETYGFVKDNLDVLNCFHVNKYFVVPESLMGRYPERYGMKLIKLDQKYDQKLQRNADCFFQATDSRDDKVSAANFHVYHFEEIDGRDYKQIIKDTHKNVMQLYQLQNRMETYKETQLNLMISKIKKKEK